MCVPHPSPLFFSPPECPNASSRVIKTADIIDRRQERDEHIQSTAHRSRSGPPMKIGIPAVLSNREMGWALQRPPPSLKAPQICFTSRHQISILQLGFSFPKSRVALNFTLTCTNVVYSSSSTPFPSPHPEHSDFTVTQSKFPALLVDGPADMRSDVAQTG